MPKPVFPLDAARYFHDGTVTTPRLLHPEGVAVAADGAIWCGGELGHLYSLSPNGRTLEERACTGGFVLGVAFDTEGRLYACDLARHEVLRFDPASGDLATFATGGSSGSIGTPNCPVVDAARKVLYVSDSRNPGPGIWRFDLDTGKGDWWVDRDLQFANGMALAPDGSALYVAETFGRKISRFPILADGAAGDPELVVEVPGHLPDGLAFDTAGNLVIACYEPSRLLRLTAGGELEVLLDDPDAHLHCHPTNVAYRGSELFVANLGRWHITALDTGVEGVTLPVTPRSTLS